MMLYLTMLYPILARNGPRWLLPWLCLAAVRNFVMEFIVIVAGSHVCWTQGSSLVACEFLLVEMILTIPSIVSWRAVYTYYLKLVDSEHNRSYVMSIDNVDGSKRLPLVNRAGDPLDDSSLMEASIDDCRKINSVISLDESSYRSLMDVGAKYSKSLITIRTSTSRDSKGADDDLMVTDDLHLTPVEKAMKMLGITRADVENVRKIRNRWEDPSTTSAGTRDNVDGLENDAESSLLIASAPWDRRNDVDHESVPSEEEPEEDEPDDLSTSHICQCPVAERRDDDFFTDDRGGLREVDDNGHAVADDLDQSEAVHSDEEKTVSRAKEIEMEDLEKLTLRSKFLTPNFMMKNCDYFHSNVHDEDVEYPTWASDENSTSANYAVRHGKIIHRKPSSSAMLRFQSMQLVNGMLQRFLIVLPVLQTSVSKLPTKRGQSSAEDNFERKERLYRADIGKELNAVVTPGQEGGRIVNDLPPDPTPRTCPSNHANLRTSSSSEINPSQELFSSSEVVPEERQLVSASHLNDQPSIFDRAKAALWKIRFPNIPMRTLTQVIDGNSPSSDPQTIVDHHVENEEEDVELMKGDDFSSELDQDSASKPKKVTENLSRCDRNTQTNLTSVHESGFSFYDEHSTKVLTRSFGAQVNSDDYSHERVFRSRLLHREASGSRRNFSTNLGIRTQLEDSNENHSIHRFDVVESDRASSDVGKTGPTYFREESSRRNRSAHYESATEEPVSLYDLPECPWKSKNSEYSREPLIESSGLSTPRKDNKRKKYSEYFDEPENGRPQSRYGQWDLTRRSYQVDWSLENALKTSSEKSFNENSSTAVKPAIEKERKEEDEDIESWIPVKLPSNNKDSKSKSGSKPPNIDVDNVKVIGSPQIAHPPDHEEVTLSFEPPARLRTTVLESKVNLVTSTSRKQLLDSSYRGWKSSKNAERLLKLSRRHYSTKELEARELQALRAYNEKTLMKYKREMELRKHRSAERDRPSTSNDLGSEWGLQHQLPSRMETLNDENQSSSHERGTRRYTRSRPTSQSAKYSSVHRASAPSDNCISSSPPATLTHLPKMNAREAAAILDLLDSYDGSQLRQELLKIKATGARMTSRKPQSKYAKPKNDVTVIEDVSSPSCKEIEGTQKGRDLDRTPAKEDVRMHRRSESSMSPVGTALRDPEANTIELITARSSESPSTSFVDFAEAAREDERMVQVFLRRGNDADGILEAESHGEPRWKKVVKSMLEAIVRIDWSFPPRSSFLTAKTSNNFTARNGVSFDTRRAVDHLQRRRPAEERSSVEDSTEDALRRAFSFNPDNVERGFRTGPDTSEPYPIYEDMVVMIGEAAKDAALDANIEEFPDRPTAETELLIGDEVILCGLGTRVESCGVTISDVACKLWESSLNRTEVVDRVVPRSMVSSFNLERCSPLTTMPMGTRANYVIEENGIAEESIDYSLDTTSDSPDRLFNDTTNRALYEEWMKCVLEKIINSVTAPRMISNVPLDIGEFEVDISYDIEGTTIRNRMDELMYIISFALLPEVRRLILVESSAITDAAGPSRTAVTIASNSISNTSKRQMLPGDRTTFITNSAVIRIMKAMGFSEVLRPDENSVAFSRPSSSREVLPTGEPRKTIPVNRIADNADKISVEREYDNLEEEDKRPLEKIEKEVDILETLLLIDSKLQSPLNETFQSSSSRENSDLTALTKSNGDISSSPSMTEMTKKKSTSKNDSSREINESDQMERIIFKKIAKSPNKADFSSLKDAMAKLKDLIYGEASEEVDVISTVREILMMPQFVLIDSLIDHLQSESDSNSQIHREVRSTATSTADIARVLKDDPVDGPVYKEECHPNIEPRTSFNEYSSKLTITDCMIKSDWRKEEILLRGLTGSMKEPKIESSVSSEMPQLSSKIPLSSLSQKLFHSGDSNESFNSNNTWNTSESSRNAISLGNHSFIEEFSNDTLLGPQTSSKLSQATQSASEDSNKFQKNSRNPKQCGTSSS